ncbi:hypothetical protein A8L51_21050 [Pantoea stewartii]|nr:hypothetical protein [Pantoea stewartii]
MNKIIALIALCFFVYLSRHEGKAISCRADVSYYWQKSRLDLLITQNLDDGKGFLSISGIGYNEDASKTYLNKTISFSYRQNKEFYYLKSEMIINSPQMTMSLSEQKKWLPDFFTNTDANLLLKIKPYGDNAWLFFTGNNPAFVCEKIH